MAVRCLMIDDSADDAALCLRRLRADGVETVSERVVDEGSLRQALAAAEWDVALVDYNIPGFSGPRALEILQHEAPTVPAITVSGAIDEETAVTTIRAGAVDYVLKDNLTRLAPAVLRAIEGAGLRRDEKRAAEQASQTMYAVEHSSQAILYVAQEGCVVYLNGAAAALAGIDSAAAIGRNIWDWSPSIDQATWRGLWQSLMDHHVVDTEAEVPSSGGGRRVISATLDLCDTGGGSFAIVYARDITEQREAESQRAHAYEALRESEERLAITLDVTGIATWDWDVAHDVWTASPQYYTMLGYEPIQGPSDRSVWLGRVHPDDREAVAAKIRSVLDDSAAHYEYEARMLHADGSYRWHRVIGHTVERDRQGSRVRIVGVRMDISEYRLAVDALQHSEAQLRTLIDTLPDLVWLKDVDGVLVSCNRRFEQLFGAVEREIVGKTDYDFTEADLADFFRERDKAAIAAGRPTVNEEELVFASDGHREMVETIKTPIYGGDGAPIGVLGVGRDITERKRSEEAVRRQAEQLRRIVEGAVLAMSNVVESRDPYTAGHERRVAELATAIGERMGLPADRLEALRWAALIHDIGKVAVPAEILAKPGRLSTVELNLIREHPLAGAAIIGAIDFGQPVEEIVRQHHERLDGSGYPGGLTGDAMLAEARILAVADVVEAMSSHRPYRAALGTGAALAEIREHAGLLYDADAVAACIHLVEQEGFAFSP
jgi:PAS domain S-box-containing protein/putative nucleotidyltransferase with HDIG domain